MEAEEVGSKAGQLRQRLEQSRAQKLAILQVRSWNSGLGTSQAYRGHVCAGNEEFCTVTQDLEAKNEELQSLRVTKLEQQGVINHLRLQLGFSSAVHTATAAGKSPGCEQLYCHLLPLSFPFGQIPCVQVT